MHENADPVRPRGRSDGAPMSADAVCRYLPLVYSAEVGQSPGITEAAAGQRVARALAKLRRILTRQGVAPSAAGLALLLGTQTVQAAPAGLAASVTAAVSGAAAPSASAVGIAEGVTIMMVWAKIKMAAVVCGVILLAGGTGAVLHQGASNAAPSPATGPAAMTTAEAREMLRSARDAAKSLSQLSYRSRVEVKTSLLTNRRPSWELSEIVFWQDAGARWRCDVKSIIQFTDKDEQMAMGPRTLIVNGDWGLIDTPGSRHRYSMDDPEFRHSASFYSANSDIPRRIAQFLNGLNAPNIELLSSAPEGDHVVLVLTRREGGMRADYRVELDPASGMMPVRMEGQSPHRDGEEGKTGHMTVAWAKRGANWWPVTSEYDEPDGPKVKLVELMPTATFAADLFDPPVQPGQRVEPDTDRVITRPATVGVPSHGQASATGQSPNPPPEPVFGWWLVVVSALLVAAVVVGVVLIVAKKAGGGTSQK